VVVDEFEEDLVVLVDDQAGELLALQDEVVILGEVEAMVDGHEVLKG
jgi:hypothetical protein